MEVFAKPKYARFHRLPRAFDERNQLTRDWAGALGYPRQEECVQHHALSLLAQHRYQIVAGYEDTNDADRLRHEPALQIVKGRIYHRPISVASCRIVCDLNCEREE